MDKEQKISVSIFNWGPCVVKMKMFDDFKNLLLSEGEKCTEDFTSRLAGIIEKEVGYSDKARAKVVPHLSNYLGAYDQMFERFVNKKYVKKPEYVLAAMWINYQRANEFNPPHDHDGKLSFVAYLKIPKEIKEEHQAYKGKSCGPGGIQFIYGDGPRECVTYQSFLPEEGDIFIFPAWLKHWVAPFKSDVTRISVSGNLHDSAPLNNVVEFAPNYIKDKMNEKK